MRQDPADFRIENTDQLAAIRHRNAQKLFDSQTISVFLVHRRAVIKPVKIRHGLHIDLGLNQLFGAAMQQTDMRINTFNHFPVQLQHKAQHAMRCRMLRAEIDREITNGMLGHLPRPVQLAFAFSSPGST